MDGTPVLLRTAPPFAPCALNVAAAWVITHDACHVADIVFFIVIPLIIVLNGLGTTALVDGRYSAVSPTIPPPSPTALLPPQLSFVPKPRARSLLQLQYGLYAPRPATAVPSLPRGHPRAGRAPRGGPPRARPSSFGPHHSCVPPPARRDCVSVLGSAAPVWQPVIAHHSGIQA